MSIASIKTLIATERSICNIVGQVIGTPRTYGDRKSEDIWRTCVCNGQWKGVDANPEPIDSAAFMTFSFRVNPQSSAYYGRVSPNGPDIDTMVIGAMGGITAGNDRPSLRLLTRASICWGYAATKEIVENDCETGVDITISLRPAPDFEEFRAWVPNPDLSFTVFRGKKRQEMARLAVESSNVNQRVFPACTPIAMAIAFAEFGQDRNVISADQIEALIDGMGAAVVGERRFFDAPKGTVTMQRYGFDDSCIYALLVGRFPFSGTQIDAVVDMFNEYSP